MNRKISFRMGITLVFILFTLLVAGTISYNFHRRFSDVVFELSAQITDNSAQRIIDTTRDFLGSPAEFTSVVARYLENDGKQDNLVRDHEELWKVMWGPLLITPQLQSLFYADEAGSYAQVRRDPEFSTRIIDRSSRSASVAEYKVSRDEYFNRITERHEENDYDPRERDWYKGVAPKAGLTWSGPFISATFKTPLVAASSPVLDPQGRVRGVVSVNIPSYGISQALGDMPLASRSVMLIVDEESQLIAHPRKSVLLGKSEDGAPRISKLDELGSPYTELHRLLDGAKPGEGRLELSAGGISYRVLVDRFPASFGKPGWRLVALTPRPEPSVAEAAFKDYAARVYSLLERPAVQAAQLAASFPPGEGALDLGRVHPELWKKMWPSLVEYAHLQSFVIGDADGSFIQVRREPFLGTRLIDRSDPSTPPLERKIYRDEDYQILSDKSEPADFDPRLRPWYMATNRGNRILWSEVYLSSSTHIPVVSATHAVVRDDGSKAGVVSANIPLYKISDFVAQARVSAHGQTMIVDKQGRVVAYPDKAQLLFNEPDGSLRLRKIEELEDLPMREAWRRLSKNPEERRFFFELDRERYIGVASAFPENVGQKDWVILAVVPERDILGKVQVMLMESAFLTAGVLLFAVLSVYFIASAVSRPIMRLAESIEGFRDFRLETIEGVYTRFLEVDKISQSILSARDGLGSFEKYVPADLVRKLIQTRQSARLGGEQAELTMMFTDVEGFTSLSESLTPDALMHHLSEYLDELSRIILDNRGTIDKYIGDAIMCFWGAPEAIQHAAHHACRTALRCRAREEHLNARWASEGKPLMHTRFGIHTGITIVGNVGSQNRLNYTVVGDNVNLASRLEGINKYYGTRIIVSEESYRQVKGFFHFRLLDRVAVKGRKKGIDIYELLGSADVPLPPETARFRELYHQGLRYYWRRDWGRAEGTFEVLAQERPDDLSVSLFLERCRHLRQNPGSVGADWEGTYVFTSK